MARSDDVASHDEGVAHDARHVIVEGAAEIVRGCIVNLGSSHKPYGALTIIASSSAFCFWRPNTILRLLHAYGKSIRFYACWLVRTAHNSLRFGDRGSCLSRRRNKVPRCRRRDEIPAIVDVIGRIEPTRVSLQSFGHNRRVVGQGRAPHYFSNRPKMTGRKRVVVHRSRIDRERRALRSDPFQLRWR